MAVYWMQAMADTLQNLPDDEDLDWYRALRFTPIREGMDHALALSSRSRPAHLGSALLDVIEIHYDGRLWAFVDSIIAYVDEEEPVPPIGGAPELMLDPRRPILGRQFTLLATAPLELSRMLERSIPANLSLGELQEIFDTVIVPALTSALSHLTLAEADETVMNLQVEDEIYEIDLGEIHLFHASLHAARCAFLMLAAYDMDLYGPDGTYGWIDDLRDEMEGIVDDYGYVESLGEAGYRLTDVSLETADALLDSLLLDQLYTNLTESNTFMTLRGDHLERAYQDLLGLRNQLEAAVAAIRSEDDNQIDDIVRIADLVELDEDIASGDKPPFAVGFTTVEDVLDWVETLLTTPYALSNFDESIVSDLQIDLQGFLQDPPEDLRELLPYHQWMPRSMWLERSFYHDCYPAGGGTWCYTDIDGDYQCQDDVLQYCYVEENVWIGEPVQWLDDQGTPIDWEVESFPYFPDYSLGGLFPGATRDSWLDLFSGF